MKNLEFKILDNKHLSVEELVWPIKRIDAVYISQSQEGEDDEYALFIKNGHQVIELYYRTQDEMSILLEFKKLVKALMDESKGFDYADKVCVINYNNVKEINYDKGILHSKIVVDFKNGKMVRKGLNKSVYNQMQNRLMALNNSLIKF